VLASLSHVASSRFGYAGLFLLTGGESSGLPLPGETALIVGALLAADGKLSLPAVIASAAAGAIVGDNVGYALGRRGIRRLLSRPGWFEEGRARFLERGEAFFERHGAKTVFIGRWLPVLRVTAAWLAGANGMEWRRFLVFNAAGGIAWATTVGLAAYWIGPRALHILRDVGLGAVAAVALALALVAGWRLWARARRT
jgi:membrane-associated protein